MKIYKKINQEKPTKTLQSILICFQIWFLNQKDLILPVLHFQISIITNASFHCMHIHVNPDSKVHGANMGPTWGRQDPGGPHVGPMNFAIWECIDP